MQLAAASDRFLRGLLLVVTALAVPVTPARAEEEALPFPPALRPAVDFWKDVFTRYGRDQVVLFDAFDVTRIYEIHRLPPLDGTVAGERRRTERRDALRERLRADLEALAAPDVDYDALTGRLRRVFMVWDGSRDPEVYRTAAENVRTQRGAREAFLAGVERSARYMPAFRRIFREEGLPEDIAFLPHVESGFLWNARSSVGALGMWQFMPATGARYMKVGGGVDERLDPWTAARAAARYLKEAYAELGSWPLSLTAYNQGTASMLNAKITTGTDAIERIIAEYRGPRFGFAGRNFYAEFLAVREAATEWLEDPRHLELDEELAFVEFPLPAYVQFSRLAEALNVPASELAEINLGITTAARGDREYLPRNFTLKVPPHVAAPEKLFAAIPAEHRPLDEPVRTHRVKSGETLGAIAARFGTSVRAIQRFNGITNPNRLRAGQVLRIPR